MFDEFITRCQQASIFIRVRSEEIIALPYTLVLSVVNENKWGVGNLHGATDVMLELVTAFSLGEVALQASEPPSPNLQVEEES